MLLSKEQLQSDGDTNGLILGSAIITHSIMVVMSLLLLLRRSFVVRIFWLIFAIVSFGTQATTIYASWLRREEILRRDIIIPFTTEKAFAAVQILEAFDIFLFAWTLTAYNCVTILS
jgi:hypothetical protein